MEKSRIRPHFLVTELFQLFNLDTSLDTVLEVSMYKLNQYMDSERSSIFVFDPLNKQLTSYSSLDLAKLEIRMSKSTGVAGWVFEHRLPAVINNAYDDSRFYRGVDDMTGFRTRNMICTPIIDDSGKCLGTIQSLNKKSGDFTTDDLELLDMTARFVVVAQNKNKCYDETLTTNITCGKFELDCLLNWRSLLESVN
ncbi:MAG: GAF domain-containing protein [Desulfobacterales bacterium]